jgi:hypothetical protein
MPLPFVMANEDEFDVSSLAEVTHYAVGGFTAVLNRPAVKGAIT